MIGQEAVSSRRIAKEVRLTRRTVSQIKGDAAGAEAALAAGACESAAWMPSADATRRVDG